MSSIHHRAIFIFVFFDLSISQESVLWSCSFAVFFEQVHSGCALVRRGTNKVSQDTPFCGRSYLTSCPHTTIDLSRDTNTWVYSRACVHRASTDLSSVKPCKNDERSDTVITSCLRYSAITVSSLHRLVLSSPFPLPPSTMLLSHLLSWFHSVVTFRLLAPILGTLAATLLVYTTHRLLRTPLIGSELRPLPSMSRLRKCSRTDLSQFWQGTLRSIRPAQR